MKTPLVSIALPVFNAERTLAAAIRSILLQTYSNWEIILIDDGSSDNSLRVAESFQDDRIRVFADGANKGISSRLNQAIDLSEGEYFARMDADDISFPDRIEEQIAYMNTNKKVDLLGTGILYFNANGCALGTLPIRETHEDICRRPWAGFYFPHPTWFGRIEWFRQNRYRSFADKAEDQDLLFRTYRHSRFACLPKVLLAYREESRSLYKMLCARHSFFKAIFSESFTNRHISVIFKLFLIQLAKITGDILNVRLGFKSLRNPLLPVATDLLNRWNQLYSDLTAQTELPQV
ncbi:glycosyltransferase family 2 protein [Thermodesulfobacteriota bacterium]